MPHVCPITREPIKTNDELLLCAPNPYSSKAIAEFIDHRGDLRDPLTRAPLNSTHLKGVRSKVMKRLEHFWRNYLKKGTAKSFVSSGADILIFCNNIDSAVNVLYVSAVHMIHLCRPRYRSLKRRILAFPSTPLMRLAVESVLVEAEKIDIGYCVDLKYTGRECSMTLARIDGDDDEHTRSFPVLTYMGAQDFAPIFTSHARCPYSLTIRPAVPPHT